MLLNGVVMRFVDCIAPYVKFLVDVSVSRSAFCSCGVQAAMHHGYTGNQFRDVAVVPCDCGSLFGTMYSLHGFLPFAFR